MWGHHLSVQTVRKGSTLTCSLEVSITEDSPFGRNGASDERRHRRSPCICAAQLREGGLIPVNHSLDRIQLSLLSI